jgi:hypothetical protein
MFNQSASSHQPSEVQIGISLDCRHLSLPSDRRAEFRKRSVDITLRLATKPQQMVSLTGLDLLVILGDHAGGERAGNGDEVLPSRFK